MRFQVEGGIRARAAARAAATRTVTLEAAERLNIINSQLPFGSLPVDVYIYGESYRRSFDSFVNTRADRVQVEQG